jgi:hypothetical protein
MPDEIDPGMKRDEPTRPDPSPDHGGAETGGQQLLACDDAVLPAGETGEYRVELLRQGVYTTL